jgi:putative membrane protein
VAPTVAAPAAPLTVPQPVSRLAPSDADFAQAALSSSALEIELARIAFVRAQSPDVRAFARQMLIDHREMAIKLDNFGLVRGYLIDWQLEPEGANTIDRLRSLDSASFDRAYMDEMVAAHERAVAMLETQAASGRETAAVANDVLPTVRHHLEMARDLQARL